MADKLIPGAFILLSLLVSGAYLINVDNSKAYYCSSSNLVGLCEKLSTNSHRCYYNGTKYKDCIAEWIPYTITIAENKTNDLCAIKGNYTYCCADKELNSGACDWIIRK
jgi:hypothetical protein